MNGRQADTIQIENISPPTVAIVILNWNGRQLLGKFLPTVTACTYPCKRVIVADNASTDDSVDFVQKQFPQVEIIQHSSNLGFAKGYNAALQQIKSDYYVLLNSDVEVTANWLQSIINLMEKDTGIAACQPKILSYDHKTQFEYAGASGGWMDNFGYPFARGRVFDVCEKDVGQYNTVQACFWASGAALVVKADAYWEAGGLDEYFFAHQEEIDLCWRLQLLGYTIYVQPQSVVYHLGGGTLHKTNHRKTFLNFRNNLIMLAKNLPLWTAVWKIPFRMFMDGIAAWKALLAGEGGDFKAIFKAHVYFFGWMLLHQKRSVFPFKKTGKPNGWYKGSVVWAYFIQKKRTFSEIVDNK